MQPPGPARSLRDPGSSACLRKSGPRGSCPRRSSARGLCERRSCPGGVRRRSSGCPALLPALPTSIPLRGPLGSSPAPAPSVWLFRFPAGRIAPIPASACPPLLIGDRRGILYLPSSLLRSRRAKSSVADCGGPSSICLLTPLRSFVIALSSRDVIAAREPARLCMLSTSLVLDVPKAVPSSGLPPSRCIMGVKQTAKP